VNEPQAIRDGTRGDLVCLAEVAWDYFRTRKRFLLSRLARRWRVVYFEPPAFGRGGSVAPREEDGVTVVTVPFLKPGTRLPAYNALLERSAGRALVETTARAALIWWTAVLRIRRPVCVISNVYASGLVSVLRPRLVCYDFNDHPLQFPAAPAWTEERFHRLMSASDLVLAVSEPYRRELASLTTAPVILLENGVEFDRFAHPAGAPTAALAALPRPRLAYVGKLSNFLDVPLLEALADRFAHPLVLAGPIPEEMRGPLRPLLARKNVQWIGEQPYESLPALLAEIDVALIPFRTGDKFTTNINPNKLYQYLAAGRPVVSSPIDGIAPDPAGLSFAGEREAFLAAVAQALARPPDREGLRALARPHDWDALAARMDELLVEHAARRASARRQAVR
jgi:glycosyltransferase involved in cell wall biosynthesis